MFVGAGQGAVQPGQASAPGSAQPQPQQHSSAISACLRLCIMCVMCAWRAAATTTHYTGRDWRSLRMWGVGKLPATLVL